MRGITRVIAPVVLFLGLTAAAHALPGLSMDAAVNVPVPSGDYADVSETGFGGSLEAFAGIPLFPLKVGGRVAYNRFGHKLGDGHSSFIEIMPSVRYGFGLPLGVLSFFGQFGVGIYNWSSEAKVAGFSFKDDGTEFGLSVGLGANAMNLFVMPMYNVMFDDDKTSYFTFNIGTSF